MSFGYNEAYAILMQEMQHNIQINNMDSTYIIRMLSSLDFLNYNQELSGSMVKVFNFPQRSDHLTSSYRQI